MNYIQCLKREGMQAWGSPCNTEKQGICPSEFRTVMAVPSSQLRGICSPFLALLKVLSPHLLLLCSAQLCLAVSVLALAHQQSGTVCRGCIAGVSSLPTLWGWIRRGVVALVMIFLVSAGLSCSALTSPQNILLFWLVTLL